MKQFTVATGRAGTPERLTAPMARVVATMRQILDVTCSADEFVEHVRVSFGRGLTTGAMVGDPQQRADTRSATAWPRRSRPSRRRRRLAALVRGGRRARSVR